MLEYCEEKPTDIASFSDLVGAKEGVGFHPSPEDTDAVRVITVHKAKGLEYPCVIVPFVTSDLSDSLPKRSPEWRWVAPHFSECRTVPGNSGCLRYMPVAIDESLADTVHHPLLTEYLRHAEDG